MGARRRFSMRTTNSFTRRAARIRPAGVGSLTIAVVAPASSAQADTGDTWVYPSRLDDGLTAARLDRCRLGFVAQAGGPAVRAVAQGGLTGTDAQMHTAADPKYWNDTPLSAA